MKNNPISPREFINHGGARMSKNVPEELKELARREIGAASATDLEELESKVEQVIAEGITAGVDLSAIEIFVANYYSDELTVSIGALDKYERIIVS